MTYDTVVFDNDGVLVGRTHFEVLRDATLETFSEFGVTDPDPDRFASRRSTVYAPNGVVATSQPLAAEAGVELLREGDVRGIVNRDIEVSCDLAQALGIPLESVSLPFIVQRTLEFTSIRATHNREWPRHCPS